MGWWNRESKSDNREANNGPPSRIYQRFEEALGSDRDEMKGDLRSIRTKHKIARDGSGMVGIQVY